MPRVAAPAAGSNSLCYALTMVSSRRVFVVLWLLLALLPLRGWAGAVTHLPAPDTAAASEAMPCHGEVAGDEVDASPTSAAASACSLCDLCHGVAALPASSPAPEGPFGEVPAATGSPAPLQVVPAPLYRPPRA